MPVRIAEIKAAPSPFPRRLALDHDAHALQVVSPRLVRIVRNGKADVMRAAAVMGRNDSARHVRRLKRPSSFEKQEHLSSARFESLKPRPVAGHRHKTQYIAVESIRSPQIVDVQDCLNDAFEGRWRRAHAPILRIVAGAQPSPLFTRMLSMKRSLVAGLLVSATWVFGATPEDLVQQGRAAEAAIQPARALELFLEADAARPNDPVILQKIAKQYSDQVPLQRTPAAKREFAQRALEYSEKAVALQPESAVNVLSLAISYGHLALLSDVRERVRYSRLIKEECERALTLDPDYAWAHHLLGRWHGEVSTFGSVARFFARVFYGGIPRASAEEGYRHLRRATELEPTELNHWLQLGFACAATGRTEEARASWQRGLGMPDASPHDAPAKRDARAALAELD